MEMSPLVLPWLRPGGQGSEQHSPLKYSQEWGSMPLVEELGEGPGGKARLEKEPGTWRASREGLGPMWMEIPSARGPEAAGPWT